MPANLGVAEILVILVVALIVLGPNRLPEAGRQVGRALAEVRRWSRSIQTEIRDVLDTEADNPAGSWHSPTDERQPAPPAIGTGGAGPAAESLDPAVVAGTEPSTEAPTEVSTEVSTPPTPTNGSAGPADEPRRP